MVRTFLIAAVLVAPFAYVTARRILAERKAEAVRAGEPAAPEPDPAELAALERDVRRVVASVREAALAHAPGERFEVTVPADATMGGRPADPALVVRLVVDDLRRSGVEVEVDDPGSSTTLRCRIA